ncbi:MAG: sugar phosphate isomerase/epimerase [Loktanella sp.]|nr:sugar phosphate isomerase/epimerase [Loktanella sp.]
MPRIAYQLYCSRNFPPLDETMRKLSELGFENVEGFGGLLADVDGLKSALQANDLAMPSCHFALDMVEQDAAGAVATAKDLGIGKVIIPYLAAEDRPTDSAGWTAFGKRLAAAGKPVQDAGLVFGWHNHAFEFDTTPEGDIPLDLIAAAAPDLMLELDLGWVRVAGHDPLAWISKYAGRLTAVHVKDIAPDGVAVDEDGWADVGHGIQDWAAIHAALQAAGVDHYVVEHDNPSDDMRFARRSLAAVQSF